MENKEQLQARIDNLTKQLKGDLISDSEYERLWDQRADLKGRLSKLN